MTSVDVTREVNDLIRLTSPSRGPNEELNTKKFATAIGVFVPILIFATKSVRFQQNYSLSSAASLLSAIVDPVTDAQHAVKSKTTRARETSDSLNLVSAFQSYTHTTSDRLQSKQIEQLIMNICL